MKVTLSVCDICQDKTKPTVNYRLVSEGRSKDMDLCAEHGAPLEPFLEGVGRRGGARTPRAEGAPSPRRGADRVVSSPTAVKEKATTGA